MKKVLVAALFLVPVGLLVWQDYGPFVRARFKPATVTGQAASRPVRQWATRIDAPPLQNFYRVSPALYRGAQPDAAGMRRLKELGIRTVVNLRSLHSDAGSLKGVGLRSVEIGVNTLNPRREELVEFLRIATDPDCAPVFVHCQRGIDRTGMMCAVYRMIVCGWSKEEALDEMTRGPFGYDDVFRNVVDFLWRLDVDELRREVLKARPARAAMTQPAR